MATQRRPAAPTVAAPRSVDEWTVKHLNNDLILMVLIAWEQGVGGANMAIVDRADACGFDMRCLDARGRVAAREGRPAHVVALQWLVARPGVVCVIPGASSAAQLRANCGAALLPPLSVEAVAALDAGSDPLREKMGGFLDAFESDDGQRSF